MRNVEIPRPDGLGLIAYTTNRSGTFDIWLYRTSDGLTYPLTQGLGEEFSSPFWSPDNRKVAFIGRGNIIYVIDVFTRASARIDQIEPYTLLDWSPDSRFLAYVKDGRIVLYNTAAHVSRSIARPGVADVQWFPSGRELLFAAPDSAGNGQLYRMNADGTNLRQITRNTAGPIHNARLSPDGSFALYTSPGASISIITTVDLSSGQTYTLEGGPLAKNYFPEWSPDSSLVAYSATDLADNRYYSLIQTDSRIGGSKRTLAASSCFATPVSWAPYGSRIAYLSGCTGETPASELWVVGIRKHALPLKIVKGGRITALQWSPPAAL